MNIKIVTINGILASIYILFMLLFSPISFGVVQIRISAAMLMLIGVNIKFYPGIVVGTVISNMLFSPFGVLDILTGFLVVTTGTLLVIIVKKIIKVRKKVMYFTMFIMTVSIIYVAIEIAYLTDVNFLLTYVYLMIGQFISQILGYIVIKTFDKNKIFNKIGEL